MSLYSYGTDMRYILTRPISFTRHHNNDATVDSICNSCSLVVARVLEETDLEYLERRHVCQLFDRRKHIRTIHRIFPCRVKGGELVRATHETTCRGTTA